ncbi:four-carbon acid sugar kinase family protein [Saxibacter everestensis]|uniref:Four-carbon acid sugar kinase family protein n=1 Tax=Saxibacter everestensis TaxID=2909229 RepID=A0ABY8QTC5_9MICO|nr:four-carbon acid sugar kinase family protein [Brevibacteriaceae bacterium ZFBP1038]
MKVLVLADDLSGAAETAAAFLRLPGRITIELTRHEVERPRDTSEALQIFDTDSRTADEDTAVARLRSALRGSNKDPASGSAAPSVNNSEEPGSSRLIFKKVDSLLRGNIAAEVAQLSKLSDGFAIFAPALPALGRTIIDGRPIVNDVPLRDTGLWRAEPTNPPDSVRDLFEPLAGRVVGPHVVPLSVVRSGHLLGELRELRNKGLVAICDAVNDDDLQRIAKSALTLPDPVVIGSAGLATAVASELLAADSSTTGPCSSAIFPSIDGSPRPYPLFLVGSASIAALEQGELLAREGVATVLVHAALLANSAGEGTREAWRKTLHDELLTGPVLVRLAIDGIAPESARQFARSLADLVAPVAMEHDLFLTGGETARRVLDAMAVTELEPVHEVHHGAVLSLAQSAKLPGGVQKIITRPGSFGEIDSLIRVLRAFTTAAPTIKEKTHS